MKIRNLTLLLLFLFMTFALYGCTETGTNTETNEAMTELQEKVENLEKNLTEQTDKASVLERQLNDSLIEIESLKAELDAMQSLSPSLLSVATSVVTALSTDDMTTLATYVHPTSGVRFSPYGYVEPSVHLNFTASAIPTLMSDTTLYTWGSFDGSGDPIIFKFSDYYDAFVYDEDYLNPHLIGVNNFIGTGNTINNVTTEYPGASFVEFHFTGFDPQYGGIDWSSLILVFENVAGDWKLVGIIHSQWTI